MGPPPAPPPCQVRCARCHEILTVAPGITEFSCPKCQLPQMLPPELIPKSSAGPTTNKRPASILPPPPPPQLPPNIPPQLPALPPPPPPPSQPSMPAAAPPMPKPPPPLPAQGIDPTKIQLPCARCKAVLNVPHGLARFNCPQCGVDLAVDLSKVQQLFGPGPASGFGPPLQEPQEEINEKGYALISFGKGSCMPSAGRISASRKRRE